MVHIPFQAFPYTDVSVFKSCQNDPTQPMKRPGRPVIRPKLGKKTRILCSVVNVSAHRGRSRSDQGLVTERVCSGINQSAIQTAASGLPVGEAACTTIWNLDTLRLLGQWIRVGAQAEKKPGTGHSKQTLNLGWYLHCCCNLEGRADRVHNCGSNSRCVNNAPPRDPGLWFRLSLAVINCLYTAIDYNISFQINA